MGTVQIGYHTGTHTQHLPTPCTLYHINFYQQYKAQHQTNCLFTEWLDCSDQAAPPHRLDSPSSFTNKPNHRTMTRLYVFLAITSLAQCASINKGCGPLSLCVPLTYCSQTCQMLNSIDTDISMRHKIRDLHCGFRGEEPMACCEGIEKQPRFRECDVRGNKRKRGSTNEGPSEDYDWPF